MNYKGYSILNESKKSKDVTVIFLSARAKSTKKDSNSMFFFEDAAKKAGVKMITVDPSSASISGSDGKHKIVDHSNGKNEHVVSPHNCVVFTRRTCLKNSLWSSNICRLKFLICYKFIFTNFHCV